ncbi:MAG TPA: hypothetical protein VHI31_07245 [Actinomycetota bacterium]|nr:hypothetical protein [Actinomycetota bacterium]
MDVKDLSATPVKLPDGQDASLLELVDSWAERVLRLEEAAQAPGPYTDLSPVKEFVSGLQVRDRLEQSLTDNTSGSSAPALIRAVDALYRAYTLQDDHRVLARLDEDLPTEPWWWSRIPAAGPLAAEFSKQARKLR